VLNADPFLLHLTVFKSRMGLTNIVLPFCSLAHQNTAGLTRKVHAVIDKAVTMPIGSPETDRIIDYLIGKNMVGKTLRNRGRYKDYTVRKEENQYVVEKSGRQVRSIDVYQVDLWMNDPMVPSTIGVPTPENTEEVIELCYQLRLLSKLKNTVTTSGLLSKALRGISSTTENPFRLLAESILLFRQFLSTDGVLLKELLHSTSNRSHFTRDEVALDFPKIVEQALDSSKGYVSKTSLRKGRELLKLVAPSSREKSGGPGVAEHRISPRLEWLADFGYLTKEGLARNAFSYIVTSDLCLLQSNLERAACELSDSPNVVAIDEWFNSSCWEKHRSAIMRETGDLRILSAYSLIRRNIGPSPISDVAFLACVLSKEPVTYLSMLDDVMAFAKINARVTLTGGRYSRLPESIYIPDDMLPPIEP
jgi:hypothetical protein